jgi:DNA-binding transcriptional ArsR family regulator
VAVVAGGNPTELVFALLEWFARDTREAHTMHQLALSTGKAYPNVHAALGRMIEAGILEKEVVGRSHRCSLNLGNDTTLLYLSLVQARRRDALLREAPAMRKALRAIDEQGPALGVLLAWLKDGELLLVTTRARARGAIEGSAYSCVPLHAFLADETLRSTIGAHTLLSGHALYASLLREDTRSRARSRPKERGEHEEALR